VIGEGRAQVAREPGVDPHDPGLEAAGDAMRARGIGGPQGEKWLRLLSDELGCSIKELRARDGGTYAWLHRHDRDWLSSTVLARNRIATPAPPRSDLGVQILQINAFLFESSLTAEHVGRSAQKLVLPVRDLVRVDVMQLRQLGQRLVTLDGMATAASGIIGK
jgi:hypothetical protein